MKNNVEMTRLAWIIFTAVALYSVFQDTLLLAQNTINKTDINIKMTFDDFAEINGGITQSVFYIDVTSLPLSAEWDLFINSAVISLPAGREYSAQDAGFLLPLGNVFIRAVNTCQTPEHDYGGANVPCANTDPARICNSFNNNLTLGGPFYIVGTAGADGALMKNPAPCMATQINGAGSIAGNANTHRFRIDLQIIPGVAPLQKGLYDLELEFQIEDDGGGGSSTLLAVVQIDIQPVLQLKMNTSSQIDFIFDDVKKYNTGVVKYGATILHVSSNMNWDLMAVGTSTRNEANPGGANQFWDNAVAYSTSGSLDIPISILELHQIPNNPTASGGCIDYSPAFAIPPTGNNNIEVGQGSIPAYPVPATNCGAGGDKTIAGNWDGGAGGTFMSPGTYTPDLANGLWVETNFRYVIDYKITPGLPVTFPEAVSGDRVVPFATPGFYTMQVRYLLMEDQ